MSYNSRADICWLIAERYDTKSNVKMGRFQSQLEVSNVSSHTEELRYNETVCLWMTIYIYIYIYIYMVLLVECSPMAQKTGVWSQVESYQRPQKRYLITPFLTLSTIRYVSRVKWSNPEKGVASYSTSWCSYWKWKLWVAFDYSVARHDIRLITYCSAILVTYVSSRI